MPTLTVTVVADGAGARSSFGWYNSVTGVGAILLADIEADGASPTVVPGQTVVSFSVDAADVADIAYFLIPNGGPLNNAPSGAIEVVQLGDGTYAIAPLGGGTAYTGTGAPAFFTETVKNAGGVDYVSSVVGTQQTAETLSGDTDDGPSGTIAWEDLPASANGQGVFGQPGDGDYNDVVLTVEIDGSEPVPPTVTVSGVPVSTDGPYTATFTFSEDVTNFDATDLAISNGTAGSVTGSGRSYTVLITPAGTDDVVLGFAAANNIIDDDGNVLTGAPGLDGAPPITTTVETVTADAVNDTVSTNEDTIIGGNVLANDIGAGLQVTAINGIAADVGAQIALTSGALLTVNADGTFTYNPNDAFDALNTGDAASDSFNYEATDSDGATDTASADVTINGVTDGTPNGDTSIITVTFASEDAGSRNSFGWYNTVTGEGAILFGDVEAAGASPTVVAGQSQATFTVDTAEVANIGYFVIPDGGNQNGNPNGAIEVVQLGDGTYAIAPLGGGTAYTGNGAPAFFTETVKNAGGVDYASSVVGTQQTAETLSGDTDDGPSGTIAWEDLPASANGQGVFGQPGDGDYNDLVFTATVETVAPMKQIALTFDDGPHPTYTPEVLAVLEQYGVQATFFANGVHVDAYQSLAQEIIADGHQLENHGYDHGDLATLTPAEITAQLQQTSEAIFNVTGTEADYLRPPFGSINDDVTSAGEALGLEMVFWTVDTSDWMQNGVDGIIQSALNGATDDGVILLHDGGGNREQTVDALDDIIIGLQNDGYEFVTLDQITTLPMDLL